jgi:hypothetical protein
MAMLLNDATVLYLTDPFGTGAIQTKWNDGNAVDWCDKGWLYDYASDLPEAMNQIQDKKYRSIYVIAPQRMYETIVQSATLQRMIGPGD